MGRELWVQFLELDYELLDWVRIGGWDYYRL